MILLENNQTAFIPFMLWKLVKGLEVHFSHQVHLEQL